VIDADAFSSSLTDDWPTADNYVYMKRLVETNRAFSDAAADHFFRTVAAFQPKRDVGVERLFKR
jgi:hypothetical protein